MFRLALILVLLLPTACTAAEPVAKPAPSSAYDLSGLSPDDIAHIGRLFAREQAEAAAVFNASKALSDRMQRQITEQDKAKSKQDDPR